MKQLYSPRPARGAVALGVAVALLFAMTLVVFFANWALDANWMYTGPHNDTKVPFIPEAMMAWPFNYFSYVVTALIILNFIYVVLWNCQKRMEASEPEQHHGVPAAMAV